MRIALLLTFFLILSLGSQAQVSTASLNITLTDIQSVKVESKHSVQPIKSPASLDSSSDLKILNPFASEIRKIGGAYSASDVSKSQILTAGNSKSKLAGSPDSRANILPPVPHFVYQINPR